MAVRSAVPFCLRSLTFALRSLTAVSQRSTRLPHGSAISEGRRQGYLFPELVLTAGLRTGTTVLAAAASLAKRCSRSRAVFTRVASSCSIYSFQAAAPCRACSSLRKCLLALRTAALSCSAMSGSPYAPKFRLPVLPQSERASRSDGPEARPLALQAHP